MHSHSKFVAWCGCWLLAAAAWAQEPAAEKKAEKPQFAKGETVEVWWGGKDVSGEIVTLEENGWVRVKFSVDG